MGLHFDGIKPPRHFVPPLLSLRAGGEITPPELAEFQNEKEKQNENEFLLIPSSPHPFITFMRIIYRLTFQTTQRKFANKK